MGLTIDEKLKELDRPLTMDERKQLISALRRCMEQRNTTMRSLMSEKCRDEKTERRATTAILKEDDAELLKILECK